MSGGRVVVVTSGFPRRSETFALNELLALESNGALAAIFATKAGEADGLQPGCERLLKRLEFLPEASPATQAEFMVQRLEGARVGGIHGYFAHTPAEVACHAAARLKVPYGFSTHARDARKVASHELAERARRAACVVACNGDVAQEIMAGGVPVHLLPHGVNLTRFSPRPPSAEGPMRLLAVGRLVEKKGFHVLLAAATRLRFPFSLRIVGEGPQRALLEAMIRANGLTGRVTLAGPMTHAELPAAYHDAHVVVVPSVQDSTGDRDGLPNVVLEALASARTVVASRISAIGSAVIDGETGMLVPPGDSAALARALEHLHQRPALREAFGRNGRTRVERDYEVGRCAARFLKLMESVYA